MTETEKDIDLFLNFVRTQATILNLGFHIFVTEAEAKDGPSRMVCSGLTGMTLLVALGNMVRAVHSEMHKDCVEPEMIQSVISSVVAQGIVEAEIDEEEEEEEEENEQ